MELRKGCIHSERTGHGERCQPWHDASDVFCAGLISRERLSWDQVGYGILILLFLSALLGAATSVKAVKRQRLMIAMGSGLLFWATLIAITALFFGGQYDGMLVTGLVILAASGIVALTGLRRENRKGTASYRRKGL